MSPRPPHTRLIDRAVGLAVAGYIGLVERTSRTPPLMEEYAAQFQAHHPMIIAMWHGQFMLLPTMSRFGVPSKAMLALHQDAEGLAVALSHYGIELIRGAGAGFKGRDRGGANAFRAAVQALEQGFSVAMTADVPPGPARRAGHGIVTLAKVSGRPILPVAMCSSRFVALPTWSRMTINLPASQLGGSFGTPIHVPADATPAMLEALRVEVETQLNIATVDAYNRAGISHRRATPAAALAAAGEHLAPGVKLRLYVKGTKRLARWAPAFLRRRARAGKEDTARLDERYGIASQPRPAGQLIWLHAASVGETASILPLIDALKVVRPLASFLLTTGTLTSAKLAAQRLGPRCIHQYVPLDVPKFAARFLDTWQPDLGVFVESEVWPNLILQARKRDVPLALINARMSKTSFRRWRSHGGVSKPLFSRFARVLAQSREYGDRFGGLGAPHVVVTGNLKFDAPPLPADAVQVATHRIALGGRPVFLAASTHADEELIVANAHAALRAIKPDLITIIVPRHPERGAEIAALLQSHGFHAIRKSATPGFSFATLPPQSGLLIADTLGELGTWFALAPIAFIGKSLSADGGGGHNPIEAVRHDAAVLTGPMWINFDETYRALLAGGGAIQVIDAATMAAAVQRLWDDPAALAALRAAATRVCDRLSGGLAKTVAALITLLPADRRPETGGAIASVPPARSAAGRHGA